MASSLAAAVVFGAIVKSFLVDGPYQFIVNYLNALRETDLLRNPIFGAVVFCFKSNAAMMRWFSDVEAPEDYKMKILEHPGADPIYPPDCNITDRGVILSTHKYDIDQYLGQQAIKQGGKNLLLKHLPLSVQAVLGDEDEIHSLPLSEIVKKFKDTFLIQRISNIIAINTRLYARIAPGVTLIAFIRLTQKIALEKERTQRLAAPDLEMAAIIVAGASSLLTGGGSLATAWTAFCVRAEHKPINMTVKLIKEWASIMAISDGTNQGYELGEGARAISSVGGGSAEASTSHFVGGVVAPIKWVAQSSFTKKDTASVPPVEKEKTPKVKQEKVYCGYCSSVKGSPVSHFHAVADCSNNSASVYYNKSGEEIRDMKAKAREAGRKK